MLILEGLDRCGKTSVAMALRKILPGWAYSHQTKPPVRAYHYFNWKIAHARPRMITDRLHFSDVAYGLETRGETGLTQHEWRLTELACLALRAQVLYLYDDLERVRSRWSANEMWPWEVMEAVEQNYQALLNSHVSCGVANNGQAMESATYFTRLPVKMHNMRDLLTRAGSPTDLLMEIAAEAEQEAWHAKQFDSPACGLGYLGPGGFLILGEAPSDSVHTDGNLGPAYPWDRGPAAEWLWQALDLADVNWAMGYFTNAQTVGSPEALGQLVKRLQPKVIISLGNLAHDQAGRCNPPNNPEWISLHHPQWERRFNHAGLANYAEQFRLALSDFTYTEV